jgi:hypothetical protein
MHAFVITLYPSSQFWRVCVLCPFCNKVHKHGAGHKSEQPNLGFRGSECGRGDYKLTVDSGSMICGQPFSDPQSAQVLAGQLIAGRNNVLRPPPQPLD